MATIKAGTYRFNDVIVDSPPWNVDENQFPMNQALTFTGQLVLPDYGIDSLITCGGIQTGDHFIDGLEVSFVPTSVLPAVDGINVGVNNCVYRNGWYYYSLQTITVPTEQEVSDEFYDWFTANTVEVVEHTVSGVWKFKDELTVPSVGLDEFFSFIVSTYFPFAGISVLANGTALSVGVDAITEATILQYYCASLEPDLSSMGVDVPIWLKVYNGTWTTDRYGEGIKIIDFGTEPQTVSAEFYEWLTANATQPTAKITYNGTTIANLFNGQTATLKCDGMKMESDLVIEVATLK